jgi:hypothetical protein
MHVFGGLDFLWWPPSGEMYAFWSSFGSCLGYLAILGLVYRKLNCSVKGCWKLGLRGVSGTEHHVCHAHHPKDKPTAQDVLDDHQATLTGT